MTPRAALCILLGAGGLLVAGCGQSETSAGGSGAVVESTPPLASGDCTLVGRLETSALRLCFPSGEHGIFVVGEGVAAEELHVEPPGATPSATDAGKVGHWAWAALSPDGSTLLAQWSSECEVPIAFLVKVAGGPPVPVTGEEDWAKSPDSLALGWTTDGRAIVFLPKGPACGTGVEKAGVYLYDDSGAGERIAATRPGDKSPVRGSIRPREADSLVP